VKFIPVVRCLNQNVPRCNFEDLFYPYGLWLSKAAAHALEAGYTYLTSFFDFMADVVRSTYTGVINDYATYIVIFFIAAFVSW